ncbi:MAG: prolipoprotein diacylglyceryl transferase family protein [Thermodesulfobacteriota bacterium]
MDLSIDVFVVTLGVLSAVLLRWAFKTLPREGSQVLASVPMEKADSGTWSGLNITYYGVLVAFACTVALGLSVLLLGSLGLDGRVALLLVVGLFGICFPASWVIARLVEKKRHTLTVSGASFLGFLSAPLVVWPADVVAEWLSWPRIPAVPTLAALAVAYAVGEGLGRLACISFGCCYGKPLSACPSWIARPFARYAFVFEGKTRKIAYEGSLDGQPVLPIQAITSIIYLSAGLVGTWLFLKGFQTAALVLCAVITQAWRVVSEVFRADYRGDRSWSAYQVFSGLAVCYLIAILFFLPRHATSAPNLFQGLTAWWDPITILSLQAVFVVTFLVTARSKVTGSTITLFVHESAVHSDQAAGSRGQ